MAVSILYAAAANSSFSSDTAPGNTQQSITRPGAAVDGSYVTVEFNVAPPGTNLTATMSTVPSGWTLITSGVKTGSPTTQAFIYGKFMTTGDTGPWVWGYSLASNVVSQLYAYDGVDTTTPFADAGWLVQAASGTSRVTPTITLTGDRFMRYGTHDRNASDPAVPAPDTATKLRNFQSASVSLVTAQAGLITNGTSFTRTFTGAASTSVAGSYAFGITPAASIPAVTGAITLALAVTGVAAQAGIVTGNINLAMVVSATVSKVGIVTGSLTLALAVTGRVQTPVERFLLLAEMDVAHRGGSADWPEETLYAYALAAAWKADMALEISMWQSSDGVWVASHDQTTGRVFSGTSLDIPTNTWATLSTKVTINGSKPIAKVTDILDLYANGNRVIYVDDKNGQDETGFYTMLASYGGTARFIIKAAGTASSWAPTASSRGYQSWGYFYHTDFANVPTLQALWTTLGMEYAGDSSDWSQIKSYSKPVLAHIISTAPQKATAAAFTPAGYMVAGVMEAVTPDVVAVTGNANLTLVVTGAVVKVAIVTGAITLPLVVAGTTSKVGIVTGAVGLALAVTGTATQAGIVTGGATLTLTVSGTASKVGVVTGTITLALAVTGTVAQAGTVTGGVTLQIVVTGTASKVAIVTGAILLTLAVAGTVGGGIPLPIVLTLTGVGPTRTLVGTGPTRTLKGD